MSSGFENIQNSCIAFPTYSFPLLSLSLSLSLYRSVICDFQTNLCLNIVSIVLSMCIIYGVRKMLVSSAL